MSGPDSSFQMEVLSAPNGSAGPLQVRVTDRAGRPIESFDVTHERQLHLFALKDSDPAGVRDAAAGAQRFSEFQHLHPRHIGSGVWQVDQFSPRSGGTLRLIADFQTGGMKGQPQSTISTSGDPATARADDAAGYRAHGQQAGNDVTFHIATPDGTALKKVDPLLGADGHLALFDTGSRGARVDMVHTHPTSSLRDGQLAFAAEMRAGAAYQGWLQLQPTTATTPVAIPVSLRGSTLRTAPTPSGGAHDSHGS